MAARQWMCIVWPAFLVAAVLEVLVFAVVDPGDLHGGAPLGVYTVSFFVFWLAAGVSSGLSAWLLAPDRVSGNPAD